MPYHKIYLRNNWSADWVQIQDAVLTSYEADRETLGASATILVPSALAKVNETSTSNLYRMFTEVLVEEYADDGVTKLDRFNGFVDKYTPRLPEIELHCVDPLGLLSKQYRDCGQWSAEVKKCGSGTADVTLVKVVEDGEDRWLIDPATWPEGYTYDTPVGPGYANRRAWKAMGRVKDMNNDVADYPDHILPPATYTIGSDLLNYLQFLDYTPELIGGTPGTEDIICEFVFVYVEGTNQLEYILLDMVTGTDLEGMRLVAGVHYNNVSLDYYVRTVWPSGITVNQWSWDEKDGTVGEGISSLLSQFAPPNYKVWWRGLQLRIQYAEQTPLLTSTSYYNLTPVPSYAFGCITSDPPDPTTSDYIDRGVVSLERAWPRDDQTFRSKIVTYGVNEYPGNMLDLKQFSFECTGVTNAPAVGDTYTNNGITFTVLHYENTSFCGRGNGTPDASGTLTRVTGSGDASITFTESHCSIQVLLSEWPAGWTEDGTLTDLLDLDAGTEHRIWYDHDHSPPTADQVYTPIYFIDLGWERELGTLRFVGGWSKREYKFGARFEFHNDWTGYVYDQDSPWQPLHPELWDREFNPYSDNKVASGFLTKKARFILITMKPAKIALRFTFSAGFSDLAVSESNTVKGTASIVRSAPAGYTQISSGTPGDPGEWYQHVGSGYDDGDIVVIMPQLYDQLFSRSTIANKLTANHRTAVTQNNSLANTNMCALEAARVLAETLRDARPVGYSGVLDAKTELYLTEKCYDPFWQVNRKFMVERIAFGKDRIVNIEGVMYGSSDDEADRGGAWTGEVPNAL